MDAGDRLAQKIETLSQMLVDGEPASLRTSYIADPSAGGTPCCRARQLRLSFHAGVNTRAACGSPHPPKSSEAHLNWALITVMTKRLARKGTRTAWTGKLKPGKH